MYNLIVISIIKSNRFLQTLIFWLAILSILTIINIVIFNMPCGGWDIGIMCAMSKGLIIFVSIIGFVIFTVVLLVALLVLRKRKSDFIAVILTVLLITGSIIGILLILNPYIEKEYIRYKEIRNQKSRCEYTDAINTYTNLEGGEYIHKFMCKNGLFHGFYKTLFSTGQLYSETLYNMGNETNYRRVYSISGSLKNYKDNAIAWLEFDETGTLLSAALRQEKSSSSIYSAPRFDMPENRFFDRLEFQKELCQGKYEDQFTPTCNGDLLNGLLVVYDLSAYDQPKKETKVAEVNYANGVRNGQIKNYNYKNGYLESEANYQNGLLDGVYKEFDGAGIVQRTVNYTNGRPILPELEKYNIPYRSSDDAWLNVSLE